MSSRREITSASSAEYFSKNLQQVGFSSYTKAVLTTIKEAIDNSLDACEEAGILPEVRLFIKKIGPGSAKNAEALWIQVQDNGPGLDAETLPKVFGEYLASSKFGRGRASRGQQGIGISAVTTWAQLTHARGATVITKTDSMRRALKAVIEVDIKNNRGVIRDKESLDWDRPHGVSCEFVIDGRIQLNGEAGLLAYINGTTLVNPHLKLHYQLLDEPEVTVDRLSDQVPQIPEAVNPHPHTMKLGEFIAHSHLFGKTPLEGWFKKGFSRLGDSSFKELVTAGMPQSWLKRPVSQLTEEDFKKLFGWLQNIKLPNPPTKSVLQIGEEGLAKSIQRLGEVDYFSVVSRSPTICDFKPVAVEVAIARLKTRSSDSQDEPVQILRFANRVPLQFDKAACAMTQAISKVNWRNYGLTQPRGSLPQGPFIMAVSVVSPFIKFKNASKETVDASDELVEEIRRALMQAGQRLASHIRREAKEADLEKKRAHIEQFGPILVQGAARISKAKKEVVTAALEGLAKILGREEQSAEAALDQAIAKLKTQKEKLAYSADAEDSEPEEALSGQTPEFEDDQAMLFPAETSQKKVRKRGS